MQAEGQFEWSIPAEFSIHFQGLDLQLFIGGVYVHQYLKNPGFPLRDPKAFLEGLLKAYLTDVSSNKPEDEERALLIAATIVELLKFHGRLADHAVILGYIERLLKLLSTRLLAAGNALSTQ